MSWRFGRTGKEGIAKDGRCWIGLGRLGRVFLCEVVFGESGLVACRGVEDGG